MKPDLTPEQKERFEKGFHAIIEKASPEIQNEWNKTKTIYWNLDMPSFESNIHLKLRGRLADEFVTLENKLKGRTI